MIDDLMNQMKNMLEGSKSKLDEIIIEVEKEGVKIKCNGNRLVMDVSIPASILAVENKEELEDILVAAINEAVKKADAASSEAMKGLAGGIIPGGLDGLF